MDKEKLIKFLESAIRSHPQLVHASNILSKLKRSSLGGEKAIIALGSRYAKYLTAQMDTIGYDKAAISQKVKLLNEYFSFYDHSTEFDFPALFTSQGKLRPTILEEFFFFLFKDFVAELKKKYGDKQDVIQIGAAKAYANLYFSPADFKSFIENPSVRLHVKDQDFAIARNLKLTFDGGNAIDTKIPILAVEVKTYIDKTMLEGVIATAEKLKLTNPHAMVIVCAETYNVDLSLDPSYSQIDQIYVLRKCRTPKNGPVPPIHADVVCCMFDEVRRHLEAPWADVKTKLENDGKII